MTITRIPEPSGALTDVLKVLRLRGVRLWSKDGRLHYSAPRGAITNADLELLQVSRDEILKILCTMGGEASCDAESQSTFERSPLAYSQLAHWNAYRLSERPAIRQVASAVRLYGRLDVHALSRSLRRVILRHDALRTRIELVDGVPTQRVERTVLCDLREHDLTQRAGAVNLGTVHDLINEVVLCPVNVAVDSLCAIHLAKLGDRDHVLVVAMEHMISDGYSLNVFSRDLFSEYWQMLSREDNSLPNVGMQFPEYARRQREREKAWIARHAAYWRERWLPYPRLRFPEDGVGIEGESVGWMTLQVRIDRHWTEDLRTWSRQQGTTVVLAVFSVYAALILHWCGATESVIYFQSHARGTPSLENTIGYLASPMYLRVSVSKEITFLGLLKNVTEEYCDAYENMDFSYLSAQELRPEFTRNTIFNWLPTRTDGMELLRGSEHALKCFPLSFPDPLLGEIDLDIEPLILFSDIEDEIIGEFYFSSERFQRDSMARFLRNFMVLIKEMVRRPESHVMDITLE
jgi:hypothetical protein